jgi:hypothetical protein
MNTGDIPIHSTLKLQNPAPKREEVQGATPDLVFGW